MTPILWILVIIGILLFSFLMTGLWKEFNRLYREEHGIPEKPKLPGLRYWHTIEISRRKVKDWSFKGWYERDLDWLLGDEYVSAKVFPLGTWRIKFKAPLQN